MRKSFPLLNAAEVRVCYTESPLEATIELCVVRPEYAQPSQAWTPFCSFSNQYKQFSFLINK